MSERPEILTSGAGDLSSTSDDRGHGLDSSDRLDRLDRLDPGHRVDPGHRLDLDEPDDELGDEPARARFGAVRRVFDGAFGPESLGITGLVLAILPLLGLTVVSRLGASMAFEETAEGPFDDANMATTITGLNAAVALAGVALGVVALLRHADASRGTRGIAGAAVLVGSVAAAMSLLVAAVGASPGYF